jgi:hypothetical protein
VELHDGKMTVSSKGLHNGTLVVIELPVCISQLPAAKRQASIALGRDRDLELPLTSENLNNNNVGYLEGLILGDSPKSSQEVT